jgi:hypothetical protein
MPDTKDRDPYTPPPMHHDRSGAVLRVTLLAAMLGAAGLGYAWMSQQPQTALVPEVVEEQQMADAGYQVAPDALPAAAPETAPAPAAAPAPQRRSAPVERAPEPVPEPEPTPAPTPVPAAPTPIPPVDMPPPGTVG